MGDRARRFQVIRIAALAALCVLLWVRAVDAGGIGVYPIRVDLSATDPTSSLQLTNDELSTLLMHATVFMWDQRAGNDRLTATRDIIVSPPIFSLHPGATQILRLGFLADASPRAERAYRLVIKEVPAEAQVDKVHLALTISIPVFVQPPIATEPKLEIRARRLDRTHVQLTFSNSGTAHVRITRLRWRDPKAVQLAGEDGSLFYVLPGAFIRRTLTYADHNAGPMLSVEADADQRTLQTLVSIQQP
jgi:fimbrial chaperone protein